jgi:hypothetical protein
MTKTTPIRPRASSARWVARSLMAVLWAAGSAYLIHHAIDQPHPNWVEVGTIPVLWAAVLAAPIIAHTALHNREWLAAVLLTVAAIVGSAWTLSGTIARQSQGETDRRKLSKQLAEAQEILATHRAAQARECASGKGKRCDGTTYTVATWEAAVLGHEARIGKLPAPAAPNAGTKRIAAFVALLPGVTKTAVQLEPDVALIAPCLFGLFIEMAALAFGLYGFRPAHRAIVDPVSKPTAPTKPSGKGRRGATTKDANVVAFVDRFAAKNRRPPSMTEMRAAFPDLPRTSAQRYRADAHAAPALRLVATA